MRYIGNSVDLDALSAFIPQGARSEAGKRQEGTYGARTRKRSGGRMESKERQPGRPPRGGSGAGQPDPAASVFVTPDEGLAWLDSLNDTELPEDFFGPGAVLVDQIQEGELLSVINQIDRLRNEILAGDITTYEALDKGHREFLAELLATIRDTILDSQVHPERYDNILLVGVNIRVYANMNRDIHIRWAWAWDDPATTTGSGTGTADTPPTGGGGGTYLTTTPAQEDEEIDWEHRYDANLRRDDDGNFQLTITPDDDDDDDDDRSDICYWCHRSSYITVTLVWPSFQRDAYAVSLSQLMRMLYRW